MSSYSKSVIDEEEQLDRLVVTMLERRLVPTRISLPLSIPLTVSDVHLRYEQLPFCYFFPETLNANELEASLAKVLTRFPTAGGKLQSNYQAIECHPDDTVSLSFARTDDNISMEDWLSEPRNHFHQSGNGHPTLLPLFDSLFSSDDDDSLMKAQVTYFGGSGGTAVAVNCNHLLGDTASCVRLVECWGRAHMDMKPRASPSLDRSAASTMGMMTPEMVDLMGLQQEMKPGLEKEQQFSFLSNWFSASDESVDYSFAGEAPVNGADGATRTAPEDDNRGIDHQYVSLSFPAPVLHAMKSHGLSTCEDATFVSTNDMVTATSWLLKRVLSKQLDWNLSVVVNLRGRCGVSGFEDDDGLFGNGITNVIAELDPSTNTDNNQIHIDQVSRAARSLRQSLRVGLEGVPDRLAHSKLGRPMAAEKSSVNTFSATSWGQLSARAIQFSPESRIAGFHGQPAHPLPLGRTFSSVILANLHDNGCTFELFLPSDQAQEAQRLHEQLCDMFIDWHNEQLLGTE
jgi:hypothetical protein